MLTRRPPSRALKKTPAAIDLIEDLIDLGHDITRAL
jgi:hypothetical protein